MMSKIKKGITFIVLLITSICFSQNDCVQFNDYEEIQEWIKKINSLNQSEKKNEILNRINCEIKINEKMNCILLSLINGHIIASNSFSNKTLNLLELIPTEKFVLAEPSINSCKCILGYLIIKKLDAPILNELNTITFKAIKRKKKKIIITLISNEKSVANLYVESFLNENENFENKKIKLKKGKNKIKIKTDNELKIIELEQNNLKSIIIQ